MLFPDEPERLAALSELIRRWLTCRRYGPITEWGMRLIKDAAPPPVPDQRRAGLYRAR
jgi:hypothetical protein